MWSLSELTQAVVIVAHVHALSIFLAGCGLYSTDAVLALLDSASCSELPTDKPSLPTCTSAHLSLTVVSIVSDILYLRWVNVSPHFLTRSATFFERWNAIRALLADTVAFFLGRFCKIRRYTNLWTREMLLPGAIFKLKIHQNAFAARALPRTPLGSLQSSPDPVDGFTGGRFTAGEGTGGGKGKGRGAFHHFFFFTV